MLVDLITNGIGEKKLVTLIEQSKTIISLIKFAVPFGRMFTIRTETKLDDNVLDLLERKAYQWEQVVLMSKDKIQGFKWFLGDTIVDLTVGESQQMEATPVQKS